MQLIYQYIVNAPFLCYATIYAFYVLMHYMQILLGLTGLGFISGLFLSFALGFFF